MLDYNNYCYYFIVLYSLEYYDLSSLRPKCPIKQIAIAIILFYSIVWNIMIFPL